MAANTYSVTVTDANNCTATLSVVIGNSNGPALSESHINASCGNSNGSVNLSVAGGTAPYTYLWSNGGNTQDISALAANTYSVTVTDSNNCAATLSVVIGNSNGPALSESHINASCGNSNGSVNLTVAGGTAPYTYLWSNGANTQDISALAANTYSVTVTDVNSCTATLSVVIGNGNGPALSESHINASCGNSNGSVNLTVTGGTASYTYLWSNGASTQDISALAANTYSVTVTDSNSCTATLSVVIDATLRPTLDTVVAYSSEPFAGSAGVTVVAMSIGEYLYQIDNGLLQTAFVFENVDSGMHVITVYDTKGCSEPIRTSVFVIDYPRYFTPNGDNYHDTWNIFDLREQVNANIFIFDRYGKLLKQISPLGNGWDGTYNGHEMPSTDYWFSVDYDLNNTRKTFKSHFSLKR